MSTEEKDIRWKQRFSNYKKALIKLEEVCRDRIVADLSELETEGLIQRFEYTFELAWKTLHDLFKEKGYMNINGPNPVIEQALKDGYINNIEGWKRLKKSRVLTYHTYNNEIAAEIAKDIVEIYYGLFNDLKNKLDKE